jgi:predicted metal-dependent phosphoesterase TrpH
VILDLHVHTVKGGPDSNLTPDELVREARRVGLDGVCLSEHGGGWDRWEFKEFAEQNADLLLIPALEVDTEFGHIIAFGLESYVSGIHRLENLRKVVDERGGFLVSVHPFRRFFDKPPLFKSLLFKRPVPLDEAVEHEVFQVVDAIEAVNGACTLEENEFALRTARLLGKPCVGGSDAHSTHGLGCGATVFENEFDSAQGFLGELIAGRYHPTNGLLKGHSNAFEIAPD